MYKLFIGIVTSLLLSGCGSETSQDASMSERTFALPPWEYCYTEDHRLFYRKKVNGGWVLGFGDGYCFIPDPDHKWENDKNWLANTATNAQKISNTSPEWF